MEGRSSIRGRRACLEHLQERVDAVEVEALAARRVGGGEIVPELGHQDASRREHVTHHQEEQEENLPGP